mgnify:CR=1 FL=1
METMQIIANTISLVTAVIQLVTALLMYKAYKDEHRK